MLQKPLQILPVPFLVLVSPLFHLRSQNEALSSSSALAPFSVDAPALCTWERKPYTCRCVGMLVLSLASIDIPLYYQRCLNLLLQLVQCVLNVLWCVVSTSEVLILLPARKQVFENRRLGMVKVKGQFCHTLSQC